MKALVKRLKSYLEHKQLGLMDLSLILGYNSPQKLYRLFNTENASPSCQIIEDIAAKFQELDLNWLFTGKGTMLKVQQQNTDFKERYLNCMEEKETLYKKLLSAKSTKHG